MDDSVSDAEYDLNLAWTPPPESSSENESVNRSFQPTIVFDDDCDDDDRSVQIADEFQECTGGYTVGDEIDQRAVPSIESNSLYNNRDGSPGIPISRSRWLLFVESESKEPDDCPHSCCVNKSIPSLSHIDESVSDLVCLTDALSITESKTSTPIESVQVETPQTAPLYELLSYSQNQEQPSCSSVDVSQHKQPLFDCTDDEDAESSTKFCSIYKQQGPHSCIIISDDEEEETEDFPCVGLVPQSDDEDEDLPDGYMGHVVDKQQTESECNNNEAGEGDYVVSDLICSNDDLSIKAGSRRKSLIGEPQLGEGHITKPVAVQTTETVPSCELNSNSQNQRQSSFSPAIVEGHKQPLFACSDEDESDSSFTRIVPIYKRQGHRPRVIMSDDDEVENENSADVGLVSEDDSPVAHIGSGVGNKSDSSQSHSSSQVQFPGLQTPRHMPFNTPITALQSSEPSQQYSRYRDDLTQDLLIAFNKTVFNDELPDLQISWNKRLTNTAGRTISSRTRDGQRVAKIELSPKVCDRYDRLRDTLIHEMCHAATWLIDGNRRDRHGPCWQSWTDKAMRAHPELPKIRRCHSYVIQKKYNYKCSNCFYTVGRHSKSINIGTARCPYCGSSLELMPSLRQDGTPAPPRTANKWLKFVEENRDAVCRDNPGINQKALLQHLSAQYRALKEINTPSSIK